MARSLNKVTLIGNLTRDPELRYTPQGAAVCTIGLATNRQWVTESGEKKEDAEFHKLVAWNKLAEICSQLLTKGRKVFVEGRLQTRSWTGQDGAQRTTTEIVINDMIILDSRREGAATTTAPDDFNVPDNIGEETQDAASATKDVEKTVKKEKPIKKEETKKDEPEDEIPF
jgi:single-strand DNA-binding protein